MALSDTVTLMTSDNYKHRFISEYIQTKIRYDKLCRLIRLYAANQLDFEPKSSIVLLQKQANCMGSYLGCLEHRAEDEGIDLTKISDLID